MIMIKEPFIGKIIDYHATATEEVVHFEVAPDDIQTVVLTGTNLSGWVPRYIKGGGVRDTEWAEVSARPDGALSIEILATSDDMDDVYIKQLGFTYTPEYQKYKATLRVPESPHRDVALYYSGTNRAADRDEVDV